MITKETSDRDILDYKAGGVILRDMSGITFLGWVAGKMNGVKTYKASNQELVSLISSPPMGKMRDEEKVRIIRKLLDLDVIID